MHSVGCYSCTGAPHSRLTVGCRDRGPGALGHLFSSSQEFLSSEGWILSHTPWPSLAPDSVILVTQGFGEQGVSLEVKGRGEGDSYHKYAGSLGCSELVNAIWYNMDPTRATSKKSNYLILLYHFNPELRSREPSLPHSPQHTVSDIQEVFNK